MSLTIVWVVAGVLLLALELFTTAFVCMFLGLGAFAAALAALGKLSLAVQFAVFAVVSLGSLVLLRRQLKAVFSGHSKASQEAAHPLLHQQGVVSRAILPGMVGEVSVGGSFWRAEAEEGFGQALDEGTAVRVTGTMPHNELILRVAPVMGARQEA